MGLDEIYDMFPNLQERRESQGTRLSGGEQQMLADGAHPAHRRQAAAARRDRPRGWRRSSCSRSAGRSRTLQASAGFTIVLVEQNFRFAAPLADRHYVIEHGRIVEGFAAAELDAKMDMLHEYLGV